MLRMFRSFVVFVVGIWLLAKAWSPVAHFWYQHRNDPRIKKFKKTSKKPQRKEPTGPTSNSEVSFYPITRIRSPRSRKKLCSPVTQSLSNPFLPQ
jgi:hypothetical protein